MNSRHLALLSVMLCAMVSIGQTSAATRVALVAGDSNAEINPVLDSATALLTHDTNLQLLDRSEVARVLREQELTLFGLARAEHALKAGQLLQADLFAVLEGTLTNGTPDSLGLVVFDAKTGVRYADSALAASNALSAASATLAAVQAGIAKSRRKPGDLHTVTLLSVRNADLPRQYDSLCDSVGLLLERELVSSPGIAILERRRLEQINKERRTAPDAAANPLLSSVCMIELDLGQDGPGLRASVAVLGPDSSRTNRLTVSTPGRNTAALSHLLAGRLADLLEAPAPPPSPDNRPAESKRFFREYLVLAQHHDYVAALHPLDAAMALAPEQIDWQLHMVRLLSDAAIELIDPGGQNRGGLWGAEPSAQAIAQCLVLAQRGAELLNDLSREAVSGFRPAQPVPEVLTWSYRMRMLRVVSKLTALKSLDTHDGQQVASLLAKDHTLRMEILEPFLRSSAVDKASFENYSGMISMWIGDYSAYSASFTSSLAEQRCQDDVLTLSRWVEMSHKLNPADGSGNYWPIHNPLVFNRRYGALFPEFRLALEQDRDPVIRLHGRSMRLASAAGPAEVRDFQQYVQDLLTHEAAQPGPLRKHAWEALETALSHLGYDPERWMEHLEACRFAFAQNEIRPRLFRNALSPPSQPAQRKVAEQLEVVNGALKLILERPTAYPETRSEYDRRDSLLKELQEKREQLATEMAGTNVSKPALQPVWEEDVCLLNVAEAKEGFGWVFKPITQDGQVYAVVLGIQQWGAAEDSLRLIRVPLEGGPPSLLGKSHVAGIGWGLNGGAGLRRGPEKRFEPGLIRDWDWPDAVRDACVGVGCYFAATCSGVLIFPLDGGPAFRLCTTNGLPSDDVWAVALLDGKLYIGAGEPQRAGYLVSYEPADGKISVLASSRRREHLSPLDDGPPFCAFCLLPEPERHRLVMPITSLNPPTKTPGLINSSMGVWTYSPTNGELHRVAPLFMVTPSFPEFMRSKTWAGLAEPGTLMIQAWGTTTLYDLRTDQLHPIYGPSAEKNRATLWSTPAPRGGFYVLQGPFLIHEGWFYSATPFERRALTDGARHEFSPLNTKYPFEPRERLQLLPDGKHILAADQYSIRVLQFKPQRATVAPDHQETSSTAPVRDPFSGQNSP
jgi:hypothetical protein